MTSLEPVDDTAVKPVVAVHDVEKADTSTTSAYSSLTKSMIVFVVSWLTLAMTFSSTATFTATNEIASDYSVTVAMIDTVNAIVLIVMGVSPLLWVPLSKFIGRKKTYDAATFVLLASSIGSASSPNFVSFAATRILSGFGGTYLIIAGQTMLADIFEPTQRGRATACLMLGTNFGPAIGPCLGGMVVTFSHWPVIFWIQAALAGVGLALSLTCVPNIKKSDPMHGSTKLLSMAGFKIFSPLTVLRVLLYPNILLMAFAAGLLSWFQYSLLVTPRHLINSRFDLTTPLVAGLFYLAPGIGFFTGTVLGGKMSDQAVVHGMEKRGGLRLPQDRLKSALWAYFLPLPAAVLTYGWGLQEDAGGLALPIVSAFFCGLGVMFAFNGLNAFCAEVIPEKKTEIVLSKYLIQYLFNAAATATVVLEVDAIGVGFTMTICVALILLSGAIVWLITKYNNELQAWTEKRWKM